MELNGINEPLSASVFRIIVLEANTDGFWARNSVLRQQSPSCIGLFSLIVNDIEYV